MSASSTKNFIASRFRGLLPVVVDVETTGLQANTDALLEIAAITLAMDESGKIYKDQAFDYQVEAFEGARIDPAAMAVTGIDVDHPLRYAIPERQALTNLFTHIQLAVEKAGCHRAVLVGHNAFFDLSFLQAAATRAQIQKIPFHNFLTFDTASLSAVALGETVLARAARRARINFNVQEAHSALYDTERTAELFCYIVNRWKKIIPQNRV